MSARQRVEIRELDRSEIDEILGRNRIGRIAFSFRDRVDVEPISYVYADDSIYGRTSSGTKLATIAHNYWVAFEVDEFEGIYDWRSVVVHGGFYALSPEGPPPERAALERAREVIRSAVPEAFTPADPVPFRDVVFRIPVQEVAGRASSSAARPA